MAEPITGSGVGLDQIATATFRASAEADLAAQRLKDALGFGAFNIPARLAIARSLAVPDRPEPVQGEPGRAIKGDTLLGTGADLAAWVSLLIEYEGKAPETVPEFQGWVRAHWTRGLALLAETLDQAGRDAGEFWRIIAQAALPEGPPHRGPGGDIEAAEAGEPTPLAVPVGEVAEDAASGQQVVWPLNAPGGSPHAAFMGGVGSGKTRTATFMLRAIRRAAAVPLIAFDFKGDMTDERNALDSAFDATVIAPPHEAVPLDVLAISDRSATGIALAAQRLRDSLATLKGAGLGAVQKGLLGDAAEQALRTHAPCRLSDVRDALKQAYAQQNRREDGAVAALDDLCRFDLFRPDLAPAEFFRRAWIIRLTADLPDLVRVSVVTLLTDALDRHLNSLIDAPTDAAGNRALRVLCVIDEAHRILGSRLPGLSGLIRQSRSKGGAVMLISQGPDDFSGEDDEFLNEMGLVVAFRTNADARAVRRILGPGANLAMLEKGQAWVKVGGAEPAPRRVICWR
jgi:DNA sulfur modification protein DndE